MPPKPVVTERNVRCPTCRQPVPLSTLGERRCSQCKETKPVAEFKNGDGYCKSCRSAYNRRYNRVNGRARPTREDEA